MKNFKPWKTPSVSVLDFSETEGQVGGGGGGTGEVVKERHVDPFEDEGDGGGS